MNKFQEGFNRFMISAKQVGQIYLCRNFDTKTRNMFINPYWALKDYSDWCLESYLEAVNYAYNGAQLNQQLTQDYIDRAWLVVKKKIALGGYRLADILSKLY